MSRIVVGVAGGIAAYKACELVRRLTEAGHDVTVVPTTAALHFVGSATWAALSGKPVSTEVWDDVHHVPHVQLGQQADMVFVAPATADLLARAAGGRADDLLTNVLLTAHGPVVFAPAMHTEMWRHPATRANVELLRQRGNVVIEPGSGRLTGTDSGPGRLPDPAELFAIAGAILDHPPAAAAASRRDMAGLRVAVSAGGTREYLDPVRFLGNSSSGLMGWALARAAVLRGAQVRLVAANVAVAAPAGAELEEVTSTDELGQAMTRAAKDADLVVMAAAPADFTPHDNSPTKIKKSGEAGLTLQLRQTSDVLAALVADRTDRHQILIGFAAETPTADRTLAELGAEKLRRKGCDLLVLNDVSGGQVFGRADNAITLLEPGGATGPFAGTKDCLAQKVWDAAMDLRSHR